MPLFILCLVLAALLLLTVVAFTAALLRVRKRSGKEPTQGHGRLCPWMRCHFQPIHGHPIPMEPLSITSPCPTAHTVPSLGLSGPVLVTHSTQHPNVCSGASNDYREMPPSIPKGPGMSLSRFPIGNGCPIPISPLHPAARSPSRGLRL